MSGRTGKKRLISAVCITMASVLMSSCASSSAGDGSIKLKVADLNSKSSAYGRAMLAWQERVTELTDGKVTFQNYWSGSLIAPDEALRSVRSGVADISFAATSFSPQELPISNWLNSFGSYRTTAFPAGYIQPVGASVVEYKENEAINREFAKQNVYPLQFSAAYSQDIICKEPIRGVDDLSGRIIRTAGGPYVDEVKALGMSNTFLSPTEVYESLQRGVIDCASITPPFYIPAGLWEVAKHYVPAALSPTMGTGYIVNLDTWNDLSLEAKQAMHDALPAWLAAQVRENLKTFEQWATEGVEKHGVVFADATPVNQILQKHQEGVRGGLAGKAPAGVEDPAGMLQRFKNSLDEWKTVAQEMGMTVDDARGADRDALVGALDKVDWDAFEDALASRLKPYRPTK